MVNKEKYESRSNKSSFSVKHCGRRESLAQKTKVTKKIADIPSSVKLSSFPMQIVITKKSL